MREQVIKCDGCARIKEEVNHWFAAKVTAQIGGQRGFNLATFEAMKFENGWEHFCGEECLLKMVARNLPK